MKIHADDFEDLKTTDQNIEFQEDELPENTSHDRNRMTEAGFCGVQASRNNNLDDLKSLLNPSIKNSIDKIEYNYLKKARKNRLTCIDYKEDIDQMIFYFETVFYHFGNCVLISEKMKQSDFCCLCTVNIEKNQKVFIPYTWNRKLSCFYVCSECFFKAANEWIYD